jgi:hypothetical protein
LSIVDGYAIITSVGDPKVFVIRGNGDQREILEPTEGNRGNIKKASDPGGRIGSEGLDLSNLLVSIIKLKAGDCILVASDGIHDNLDPELLGADAPEEGWTQENKANGMRIKLKKILKDCDLDELDSMNDAINRHLQETTKAYVVYQLNNNDFPPKNYKEYPGKPDHAGRFLVRYRG